MQQLNIYMKEATMAAKLWRGTVASLTK